MLSLIKYTKLSSFIKYVSNIFSVLNVNSRLKLLKPKGKKLKVSIISPRKNKLLHDNMSFLNHINKKNIKIISKFGNNFNIKYKPIPCVLFNKTSNINKE
jgi:hypothetical protein